MMRALSFGEILWDINGGSKTLGGAPLNVAGHIIRLGGRAVIISALGRDEYGKQAMNRLAMLGADASFVHISDYATGVAEIKLEAGIPSYIFNDPAAWDDISLSPQELERLKREHFDAVIYGTLASRHERTRSALFSLLECIDADEFFFDVNLRLSFWAPELIRQGLERATVLKMSDEEVSAVARAAGVQEDGLPDQLFDCFPALGKIILTKGKSGSFCYERGGRCAAAGCAKVKVVSTVGAGDSLSAAFLYFCSLHQDTQTALEKASLVADYVVTKEAAIPEYDEDLRRALGL